MASTNSPVIFVFETDRNDWLSVARIIVRLVKGCAFDLSRLRFWVLDVARESQ